MVLVHCVWGTSHPRNACSRGQILGGTRDPVTTSRRRRKAGMHMGYMRLIKGGSALIHTAYNTLVHMTLYI